MKRFSTCLAALTILLALNLRAQALGVGDPAPKLQQGKYVQGDPVKEFEKGKVYVMEFWATWCGPCIAAIPHVDELQKKYADKGLIVIGQNVWERDESKVEPFVQKMKEKMTYRIAMDDKSGAGDGAMAETWMKAANQNGIPCSMIVNQEGIIAWIGHPMTMDKPLEQIMAGKFDIATAKKEAEAQVKARGAQQQIAQAMQSNDWKKAIELIDAQDEATQKMLSPMKLQALQSAGEDDKAKALVESTLADKGSSAQQLMAMAQRLIMGQKKNPDLAEKLANGALERQKDEAQAHWLLGKVHAERGHFDKAVEAQKKAVANAPDQMKEFLNRELKQYEEKAGAKKE